MTQILINCGIIVGTFLFMEWVAWATHKYIMHGGLVDLAQIASYIARPCPGEE